MKRNLLTWITGIFLVFAFALTGCPTASSGTDTETSVIKVTNVPEGTSRIFVTVYDDFTTKTTLAYGEAVVSGGTATLGLLTPGGKQWTGTDTVAIAALADRASGKRWDAADLGEEIHTLDWSAGAALEGELFDAVKLDAQIISPITEEEEVILPSLDDELTFATAGEIKYYSLSTGEEVEASKANTTEWDIAIEKHTSTLLLIYTNSGVTAIEKGSAGEGGVWFADSTDFDAVTLASKKDDFSSTYSAYEPYVTDTVRWITGSGSKKYPIRMNMMTFYGFSSGDGLAESLAFGVNAMSMPPDLPNYKMYNFDKKAAYRQLGMPPVYTAEEQVYIIRHADGTTYSKFQLSAIAFASSTYSVTFKYAAVE